MHKGYKCLDRSNGRIYISRDVVFDEHLFPFASSNPSCEPDAYVDHMRNYRPELLASNLSVECSPVSVSDASSSDSSNHASAPSSRLW